MSPLPPWPFCAGSWSGAPCCSVIFPLQSNTLTGLFGLLCCCLLKHKKKHRKHATLTAGRRGNKERVKEKGFSGRGRFLIFLPGWLVLHCTKYEPHSVFPLSFLSLFCLSQCEGVYGCGGLASRRWRPVGVFMVYFWPQQQKAC